MCSENVSVSTRFVALGGHDLDLGDAGRERERGLERVGEAALDPAPPHQAVDDHFDGVVLVAGQTLARCRRESTTSPSTRARVNPC